MGLINSLLNFMQNPDNSWILYGIALFMIVDAFALRFISRRKLAIKGDNNGIAINGDVKGSITQTQTPPATNKPSTASTTASAIGLAANLSGIIGLTIAAATFYLSYINPA